MTLIDTTTRKLSLVALMLSLSAPFSFIWAQTVEVNPKVVVSPVKAKIKVKQKSRRAMGGEDTLAEKSIAVDAKVNITLCVLEGRLKVIGWERNEIRAFVANGSNIGFNVRGKNKQSNAVLLNITGFNAKSKEVNSQECLSGEDIELDVPRGATINVKGRTSETTVEMVRKVDIRNLGGDIYLDNIEQGINALTYEGGVTVENSGGAINLETTNGNIVAFDVAPTEIGDVFKAKTVNGAIALQQIGHRQNEVTSNSGSIKFVGEFQSGGQYYFRTQNGTISLTIPEKSSCKINASYGFGAFDTEIPLQNVQKNANPNSRAQSLSALMGGGDANVNLTTVSGAIRLKKQ